MRLLKKNLNVFKLFFYYLEEHKSLYPQHSEACLLPSKYITSKH